MTLLAFYSHDGEGLGHLRRNTNIAQMICDDFPGTSAFLLTGCQTPHVFGIHPAIDTVKIPTLLKTADGNYVPAQRGISLELARRMRQELLLRMIEGTRPRMLVVDKYPGGLNNELIPALQWLRKNTPETKIVLGLRDILDAPVQTIREWNKTEVERIVEEFYDRVWIYGDEKILATADFYQFPESVRAKARYCGYIIGKMPRDIAAEESTPYVVATVGGGRDGRQVLEAALQAVAELRKSRPDVTLFLFAGSLMSQRDYSLLRRKISPASEWAKLDRFSNRLKRYLIGADAIITMGGYNTMMECLAAGRPTIVVPRETPRSEQVLRAEIFESKGYIKSARMNDLELSLSDHLRNIMIDGWKPRDAKGLQLDGFKTIHHEIQRLLSLHPHQEEEPNNVATLIDHTLADRPALGGLRAAVGE